MKTAIAENKKLMREIVYYYFTLDHNLKDTGKKFKVSHEAIRQALLTNGWTIRKRGEVTNPKRR